MVNNLLYTVAQWLAQIGAVVLQNVGNQIQSVVGWFSNMASSILNWMSSLIVRIANWVQTLFAAIYNYIIQLGQSISQAFSFMVTKIMEYINYALNGVYTIVNSVISKIQAGIDVFISMVRYWIGALVDWFKSVITSVIENVKSLVNTIVNTVKGWIDAAMQKILQVYDAVLAKISRGIDQLIGGSQALINTVAQRLGDLRGAFKEVSIDIIKTLSEAPQKYTDAQLKMMKAVIDPYVKILPDPVINEVLTKMRTLVEGRVGLPQYRDLIGGSILSLAKASPPLAAIFTLMTIWSAVGAAQSKLADVYTKPILQEIAAIAPYEILSPIDIAAAWRRGYVDEGRAVDVIKRQGYTVDDARVILRLADTVPAEFELVAMELRGLISVQETNDALRIRGFDQKWAGVIRAMGQVIPPVQDLITMAVREAFSPDIAARFGQYEGFPEEFATWAQKQGLTPEWAKRYWAAHWSLPSPMQGFEMFQRRIISKEDLQLLLRALDIMPFWRDKLIDLSYNPLTRVDVRRMHQLGVLSDQDVYNSYLDIGYSPENAARLQDFTLKLNKGSQVHDDEELGRLTRTAVLNFYGDGLITKEKALEYLTGMGITPDAAFLYVRAVDMNEQLELRRADADFVVEQAQAGILTFTEAQDQLNNMGLEPVEVRRAVNKLVRLLASKTKLPTKAEAEKMWEAGIIAEDTYRDVLSRIGYAAHWVEAFVRLAKGK